MIILAVVDNAGGMLFNRRRVSMDRALRGKILELAAGAVLWMDGYSSKQFREEMSEMQQEEMSAARLEADGRSGCGQKIHVSENFLDEAGDGDFCFVEDRTLMPYAEKIEKFYLFHWNRDYPSDFKLDFVPGEQGFSLADTQDFQGYSHDDITMEVWDR